LFIINQEPEGVGLKVHYLDKDGNEIFSIGGFTIVDGRSDVYEIYFDISAINQDVPIENIQVVNAYPQAFEDSLVGVTPQSLAIDESKTLWTSEPMLTEQFESISPVNFWIELSGENSYTQETIYPDRAYSGIISFVAEVPEGPNTIDYMVVSKDDLTCNGMPWYTFDRNIQGYTGVAVYPWGICYNSQTGDYLTVSEYNYIPDYTCLGKAGYTYIGKVRSYNQKLRQCFNPITRDRISISGSGYTPAESCPTGYTLEGDVSMNGDSFGLCYTYDTDFSFPIIPTNVNVINNDFISSSSFSTGGKDVVIRSTPFNVPGADGFRSSCNALSYNIEVRQQTTRGKITFKYRLRNNLGVTNTFTILSLDDSSCTFSNYEGVINFENPVQFTEEYYVDLIGSESSSSNPNYEVRKETFDISCLI